MWLFLWLIITSCNSDGSFSTPKSKQINIGNILIEMPEQYFFTKVSGVDSYVAYIITTKKDTFHLEVGKEKIIYNLFDLPPKALSIQDKDEFIKRYGQLPPVEDAVFTDSPEEDNLQNIFQKNFYLYDTINGMQTKIVQPKRIGDGKTGLFISKLPDGNSFSIYANNLDSVDHLEALKMFKTIVYNKRF